jgi:hypothetical protein
MDGKGKFTVHWQAERDDRTQPTPRSDTPPRSWETSLALLRQTSSYRTQNGGDAQTERSWEGREDLGPPRTVRYEDQILPAATSARVTRKDL